MPGAGVPAAAATGRDQRRRGRCAAGDDALTAPAPDRLAGLFADLAEGRAAGPPDWTVEVVPAPPGVPLAVWGFPAYHVVAVDRPADDVRRMLPEPPRSPMTGDTLAALGDLVGARPGELDLLLVSVSGSPVGSAATAGLRVVGSSRDDHLRVARALEHRTDVVVAEVDGGVLTVGRGVAGRTEVSVEVDPAARGRGLGRRLAAAAHALSGSPVVWAQVTPGNTASLRAFLAAGYRPVGSEVLFERRP